MPNFGSMRFPAAKIRFHLEGLERQDNRDRHSCAISHAFSVGQRYWSDDDDVVFAERRMNPPEESRYSTE